MPNRKFGTAAVAALVAFAVAGCSSATQTRPRVVARSATDAAVTIPGADRFTPSVVVIARGERITFHNGDTDAHTVRVLVLLHLPRSVRPRHGRNFGQTECRSSE